MKFPFPNYTHLLCVFLSLHLSASSNLPPNVSVPALYVFGDSIVDTGNNNYIKTTVRVNFPPYGKDFKGGVATGRFSDGKVPPDYLAEELGLKELLPPYLDPSLQPQDLLTGVNFASGGAGYDPLTSKIVKVLSMTDQLELFKEYVGKLNGIAGEERSSRIIAESLYIVVCGTNDIANTFFTSHIREAHYDIGSYTTLVVNSASSFVQELYGLGARRIGVFGLPPIGCIPAERTLVGGVQRNCAEKYNQAAQMFNSKLVAELESLNNNFPTARLVYIDIYDLPLDLIFNPTKYGFEIGDKGCCGTGVIEVWFLCKSTCTDVSKHVFWDSFHLTGKAYKLLVQQIYKKYMMNFLY